MRETAGELSRSIKDYSEETRNLFAIENGSSSRFQSPEAIEGERFWSYILCDVGRASDDPWLGNSSIDIIVF